MESPMRPTPTMPTRSLCSFAIPLPLSCGPDPRVARMKPKARERAYDSSGLHLRLQHLCERFSRIGQLGGIDRDATLDQPPRHGDVALGIDAHGIGEVRPVEL